jgi:hypothetical protein
MSHDHRALIAQFRETLTQQRYRGYGNDSRQNGPFASNSQKPNALA